MICSIKIGNLILKNPVTVASGTAGYGEELANYIKLSSLGAIFTKGLSLKPRQGNQGNRIIETSSGILNSIGLENVGLDVFLKEKLPFLLKKKATVIPNVAGHSIEENIELCKVLSGTDGIDALELNVSCPNVKEGGIAFGQKRASLQKIVEAVRKVTDCLLIVKLSPNVCDIASFAQAAKDAGADAVSLINTLLGMKIDIKTRRPHFKNKVAGLSGPAIKPVALRMVYEVYRKVDIPIIGVGGIATSDDVLEFVMAGASAVSIGTMNLVYPDIAEKMIKGINNYLAKNNINDITALIGCAHNE